MSQRTLAAHVLRRVAVASDSDPRSVRKVIAGERVLPRVREKIVRALKDQGFGHLVDESSDGPRAA